MYTERRQAIKKLLTILILAVLVLIQTITIIAQASPQLSDLTSVKARVVPKEPLSPVDIAMFAAAESLPKTACAQGLRLPCSTADSEPELMANIEVLCGGVYEDLLIEILLDMRHFLKTAECDFDYFGDVKEDLIASMTEGGQEIAVTDLQIIELNSLQLRGYAREDISLCLTMEFPVLFLAGDQVVTILGFIEDDQIRWSFVSSYVDLDGGVSFVLEPDQLLELEQKGALVCVLR